MTNANYRRRIEDALAAAGFRKAGKLYLYSGNGVTVLVALQKVEHEHQFFVNVGFWLGRFGTPPPDRVELTHLYFRLERLFPEHRETILCAGKLDDAAQASAFDAFSELLRTKLAPRLVELSDQTRLQHAFREGWLEHGLIRKEARDVL